MLPLVSPVNCILISNSPADILQTKLTPRWRSCIRLNWTMSSQICLASIVSSSSAWTSHSTTLISSSSGAPVSTTRPPAQSRNEKTSGVDSYQRVLVPSHQATTTPTITLLNSAPSKSTTSTQSPCLQSQHHPSTPSSHASNLSKYLSTLPTTSPYTGSSPRSPPPSPSTTSAPGSSTTSPPSKTSLSTPPIPALTWEMQARIPLISWTSA